MLADVSDRFQADLFQRFQVNIRQLLHINAGLAYFELAETGQCFAAFFGLGEYI